MTDVDAVRQRYRTFAEAECRGYSDLYFSLSTGVADSDELARFIAGATRHPAEPVLRGRATPVWCQHAGDPTGQRSGYVADRDLRDSVHFAAGLALCEGAGCVVTDLFGQQFGIFSQSMSTIQGIAEAAVDEAGRFRLVLPDVGQDRLLAARGNRFVLSARDAPLVLEPRAIELDRRTDADLDLSASPRRPAPARQ